MPYQQEGQDGGELPEDQQHQGVVRGDQGEHHPGEGDQLTGEVAQPRFVVLEVARAVEQDQRPDGQHDHRHDPREAVEAEVQLHVQGRDPRDGFALTVR